MAMLGQHTRENATKRSCFFCEVLGKYCRNSPRGARRSSVARGGHRKTPSSPKTSEGRCGGTRRIISGGYLQFTRNQIGYSKDVLSKIGEPYIKSYKPSTKSKSGLGLGIFIGKTLLEKNYANILCRNSKTRSGAEVSIKWKNKDFLNI